MIKGRTRTLQLQGRDMRAMAASIKTRREGLPAYETRTCAHCGRTTTFVLEEPSGGWYLCVECGRYS